jgi:hypothetical protein
MLLSSVLPQGLAISDSPTFVGLTLSGLTSDRVIFVGSSNELADDANLVWDSASATLDMSKFEGLQIITAKAGENITQSQAVYIADATGDKPRVYKADNTLHNKSHSLGIAVESKTTGQNIDVAISGELINVDTSAYSAGDRLHLFTAGSMQAAIPTSGAHIHMGFITKSDASEGIMFVSPEIYTHDIRATTDIDVKIAVGSTDNTRKIIFEDYGGTDLGYIDGAGLFSWSGGLLVSGDIGITGTRVVKGWFTDLEVTNMPTVSGTAIDSTFLKLDASNDPLTGSLNLGANSLIGGTGTTDDLTLQATSGVGESGSDIIFLVGNNGATEAGRILYDGKWGIGTDTPIAPLYVNSTNKNITTQVLSTISDFSAVVGVTAAAGKNTVDVSDTANTGAGVGLANVAQYSGLGEAAGNNKSFIGLENVITLATTAGGTHVIQSAVGVKSQLKRGSVNNNNISILYYYGFQTEFLVSAGTGNISGSIWTGMYLTNPPADAAPTALYGMYIERQTRGANTNYGIALAGDDNGIGGAAIHFGAAHDANIGYRNTFGLVFEEVTDNAFRFIVSANTDISMNFEGTTNSGLFKWMEDEDYFEFANDIHLTGRLWLQTGSDTIGVGDITFGRIDSATVDSWHIRTDLIGSGENLHIDLDRTGTAYNVMTFLRANGNVGIGEGVTPTGKLHVDQASTTGAMPVLRLDQGDIDDSFIDFVGTSAADGSRSISSDVTEEGAKFGAFRVEINGVTKWVRVYDDHS